MFLANFTSEGIPQTNVIPVVPTCFYGFNIWSKENTSATVHIRIFITIDLYRTFRENNTRC